VQPGWLEPQHPVDLDDERPVREVGLTAATKWTYRPATADGKPVKFLRRIQVNISEPKP
jgi:hypothetical protein